MNRGLLAGAVVAVAAAVVWFARSSSDVPSSPASSSTPSRVSSTVPPADLVAAVRAAGNARDFVTAADLVAADRAVHGPTPLNLEAQSWIGRTALAAGDLDRAERFARETYDLATAELAKRPLDADKRLPIALGAAIEVLGQTTARRGARTEAVAFLEREVARHRTTSIATRIQKNVNLISLNGTPAPPLDLSEYLGAQPVPVASLKGRVVLMFFWAHWCSDCKEQAPVLAALQARYADRGLTVVAPTTRFGYVAEGREAPADEERRYIDEIRQKHYPSLERAAIPLSAENHLRYGVSTTPTLVLVDRSGVIRLYHPGQMSEAQLEPLVQKLIG